MAPGIEVAKGAGRRVQSVRFQRVTSSVNVTLRGKRMGSSRSFSRILVTGWIGCASIQQTWLGPLLLG
jgi:hypothetical protein